MNLKWPLILLGVVIAAIIVLKFYPQIFKTAKMAHASIDNHVFNLYLATTPKQQQVGLSGRKTLPQNYGMLFPFSKPGYYAFWMKNMKFPLDIIYIYKNHISNVFANLKPPKSGIIIPPIVEPEHLADTVLEINAGLFKKYDFKIGDSVMITNPQ